MHVQWIKRNTMYAPSWMIIGISLVLMVVVLFMGIINHHREKNSVEELLQEKGAALIQSFEAGARTGMMGRLGNEAHLQTLLEETAARSDIASIALVDKNGVVLADSEKQRVGTTVQDFAFSKIFTPTDKVQWRIRTDAGQLRLFEVYKRFLPIRGKHGGHGRHGAQPEELYRGNHMAMRAAPSEMDCSPEWIRNLPSKRILDPDNRPALIIGMNIQPYATALADDLRNTLITASIIFLLALGGVVSLFWAQHYVNSRKLLRDIRAFASEIVRNLPVGMVVISGEGTILFINEAAGSLLSLPLKTAEGRPADQLLPKSLLHLRKNISRQRPVVEQELTFAVADRGNAIVNVSTTDMLGEEGQYIGCMFILQDVSELRNLERSVRQREKLAAIGNLAAGIAHEIRNPLSSIKGYVTYFGSLFAEGSEKREAATIMAGEVDRVNRVISELLEFARPSDLKPKPTDLRTLIDHSLHIIAYEAQTAGVRVRTELAPDLPTVMVDPDRITQVLLNIFINALQAMQKGGELLIAATQEEERLMIRISDTGTGIALADQVDIFNPYFTTKKNGTGLGLAIVHKIIEDHGGSLQVDSSPGQGTTLTIILPLQRGKEA